MKLPIHLFAIFSVFVSLASADESEFRTATIDLGIVVSDLDKSMKFYTEAVGFNPTGEFTAAKDVTRDSGLSAGEEIVIKKLSLGKGKGATTIKLMQSAVDKSKMSDQTYITSSLGFSYLTIHVNSTKTALERLKKAGVKVLAKGPAIIPGGKVALTVVKDPDGNFVELVGPADHQ
ncbi:MAG TPA: bleomycin resistance protein [Verrucomicrobiales bacterium]|nr:bleomycin resistance protein [Verrucomicrobiales bacterium]HCN81873.1 bleomycin resistance protein [Verrucomicrobiales bacterium]|tara:strand:- start:1218 stop:1745 length:528 start_codon:yes stop_codon:yes gene_type:complete